MSSDATFEVKEGKIDIWSNDVYNPGRTYHLHKPRKEWPRIGTYDVAPGVWRAVYAPSTVSTSGSQYTPLILYNTTFDISQLPTITTSKPKDFFYVNDIFITSHLQSAERATTDVADKHFRALRKETYLTQSCKPASVLQVLSIPGDIIDLVKVDSQTWTVLGESGKVVAIVVMIVKPPPNLGLSIRPKLGFIPGGTTEEERKQETAFYDMLKIARGYILRWIEYLAKYNIPANQSMNGLEEDMEEKTAGRFFQDQINLGLDGTSFEMSIATAEKIWKLNHCILTGASTNRPEDASFQRMFIDLSAPKRVIDGVSRAIDALDRDIQYFIYYPMQRKWRVREEEPSRGRIIRSAYSGEDEEAVDGRIIFASPPGESEATSEEIARSTHQGGNYFHLHLTGDEFSQYRYFLHLMDTTFAAMNISDTIKSRRTLYDVLIANIDCS